MLQDSNLPQVVLGEVHATDESDCASDRLNDIGKLLVVKLPAFCVMASSSLLSWFSDLHSQVIDLPLDTRNDLFAVSEQPFSWVGFFFEYLFRHVNYVFLALVRFVRKYLGQIFFTISLVLTRHLVVLKEGSD